MTHSQWHQELSHTRNHLFSATVYIEELESALVKSNQASAQRAVTEQTELTDATSATACVQHAQCADSVGESQRPDELRPPAKHKSAHFVETAVDDAQRSAEACECEMRWAKELVEC
eukprot:583990-Rhodomonas_salina.1